MADRPQTPPTSTLLLIAAGLVGATYLQTALLEYPATWFGRLGTLVIVIGMLAAQVLLASLLYRNVRRSSDVYSLFFRRAALVVLATFVTLTATLLVPREVALVRHDLHDQARIHALLAGIPA